MSTKEQKQQAREKRKVIQLIIQIGTWPHIQRYFVSPVCFFSREQAKEWGKRWLEKEGFEQDEKYLHTRRVWRGTNRPVAPRKPHLVKQDAKAVTRWIHDDQVRRELGIQDRF